MGFGSWFKEPFPTQKEVTNKDYEDRSSFISWAIFTAKKQSKRYTCSLKYDVFTDDQAFDKVCI